MNRYTIGFDDHHNNVFDYEKVLKDIKDIFKGKKKWNRDLYEVMSLRFTIAHYNMEGWLWEYNGCWSRLANEIDNEIHWYNWDSNLVVILEKLVRFLKRNSSVEIAF